MENNNHIGFKVLGDFGPFSRAGKSIGYMVHVGSESFLVDCGSPLFNQIGGMAIENISGLIITHCHDDHKRWFTDLALYYKYASTIDQKLFLLSAEDVLSELRRSSSSAMNRTLSMDSSRIIDLPFDDFVSTRVIGPRALYRIAEIREGNTRTFGVIDSSGMELPPDRAKVVINPLSGLPRMLFKDPTYGEWVEPESFYSFNSESFYEKDQNSYIGDGFKFEAIKAPVWHGIPGIGLRISTATETLVFTSDTVHDTELWKRLHEQKREPKADLSSADFLRSRIINGDINDYIERTWSSQRYDDAVRAFDNAVVVHDVSLKDSIVHTDYDKLHNTNLDRTRTILTHSPDSMTSDWPLSFSDKHYIIKNGQTLEHVGGVDYHLDAHIYHKAEGKFFVGYKRDRGAYGVYEKDRLLSVHPYDNKEHPEHGTFLYRVDLYEDIMGSYFPRLDTTTDKSYIVRTDGMVELVKHNKNGSSGQIVKSLRRPASVE